MSTRLKISYNSGVNAAFSRFKLAGPLGANVGVMPKGPEVSHGTSTNTYPKTDATDTQSKGKVDSLWNISDIGHMSAGHNDEVIG